MSDLLDRAKAALEGVTPGPWEMRDGYIYPLSISAKLGGIWPADAEFIADARQLVPELITELERLQRVTDIIDPDSVYREQRDQARARLAALEQAVARVRELHGRKPFLIYGTEVREWHCRTCDEPHPCATIRALGGKEAP